MKFRIGPKIQSPLAKRFLFIVFGLYFLVAITLTVTQLLIEIKFEKTRLDTEIYNARQSFELTLGHAIWNFNNTQVRAVVESLLRNEIIIGTTIESSDKEMCVAGKMIDQEDVLRPIILEGKDAKHIFVNTKLDFSKIFAFDFPIEYQHDNQIERVGTLRLYSSSDIVIERAMNTIIVTLISALLKTLSLWVIFLIFLDKLVVAPLEKLKFAMKTLNPDTHHTGKGSQHLKNASVNGDNEISRLMTSFVDMEHALAKKDEALELVNKELIEQHKLLEEKVEERTLSLRRATEAKSEFLAMMSHEIRTPMNGVLGVAQLLKNLINDPVQTRYINAITGSGEALLDIINNILDYSKLEAGKMEIESIDFDLERLVEDSVFVFSVITSTKHIELISHIDSKVPPFVLGDPTRVRQILSNLISNAVKFTEQGEIAVLVNVESYHDNNEVLIRFSVRDSGIGMEPEDANKIFQSFSQAESSTTRKYGGTGLGLSICKQLSELMGGAIGVTSEPNKGSTFWFTIRVKASARKHQTVYSDRFHKRQLLLVDQNKTFRDSNSEALRQWGFIVHSAQNSAEAHEIQNSLTADNTSIQLAIININLPSNSGLQLAQELAETNPAIINILLINPTDEIPATETLKRCSIVQCLEKPISKSDFYNSLSIIFGFETLSNTTTLEEESLSYLGLKTLVAEDNDVNLIVIKGMLEKYGIEPSIARNGKEAVEAFKTSGIKFDLVVLDFEMPVLDGWQAAEQIREHEKGSGRRVPIVGLTAHALVEHQKRALESGMDMHLCKPVTMDSIKKALDLCRANQSK